MTTPAPIPAKISAGGIPMIIHQLWIGPKPAPVKLMDTWKNMNPEFVYVRWTEAKIEEMNFHFKCQNRIDEMKEINGKADIMRWEILREYGGIFIDADSFCIKPIDDELLNTQAFAGWEQETLRPGLIATVAMGFPPDHLVPNSAIQWTINNSVDHNICGLPAWRTVGPGLVTRVYNENSDVRKNMTIFSSNYFLPVHCTGKIYNGHGKVYAHQEWGSTKQSYEKMHLIEVPDFLKTPTISVSVLVPCFNVKAVHVKECIHSIQEQVGNFNIELVWIDDGSAEFSKTIIKKMLDKFILETRNTTLVYYEHENGENKGLGTTLKKGVELCSNELIFRMDADDIMMHDRIHKQLVFFQKNPTAVLCGGQVEFFEGNTAPFKTEHAERIEWDKYIAAPSPNMWFMNHPTVAFKKSAVLAVGNYNADFEIMVEDYYLWIQMMKRFGTLHNLPDVLLKYRIHKDQVTNKHARDPKWQTLRLNLLDKVKSGV